ncbi:uncharacterized protein LOC128549958 [Mercenaria mercenaria]|uniref:uncharacterized protein LOC128549958 n=1 Tax=Mercenaria mercenaria TaxID=6596 RepID=UPI00234E9FAC|nr:uncharacterized protein LOC128549958 [Mercenaria mercenaria]
MAEADNEDEKFVKNIIHELSAFQKSDTTNKTGEQAAETVDTKHNSEMNGPEQVSEAEKSETVTSENVSTREDKSEEPEASNAQAQEPTKQPSRIIRLSRPYNPYSSARTSVTSVTTSSSASISSQSTSSTVNGTVTSSTVGPGAPGSRLAALQRPGSPMHRILQRAQSPALAAAARMTRQTSGDGTPTGACLI